MHSGTDIRQVHSGTDSSLAELVTHFMQFRRPVSELHDDAHGCTFILGLFLQLPVRSSFWSVKWAFSKRVPYKNCVDNSDRHPAP